METELKLIIALVLVSAVLVFCLVFLAIFLYRYLLLRNYVYYEAISYMDEKDGKFSDAMFALEKALDSHDNLSSKIRFIHLVMKNDKLIAAIHIARELLNSGKLNPVEIKRVKDVEAEIVEKILPENLHSAINTGTSDEVWEQYMEAHLRLSGFSWEDSLKEFDSIAKTDVNAKRRVQVENEVKRMREYLKKGASSFYTD